MQPLPVQDISTVKERIGEVSIKTYYLLVALGLMYQHFPHPLLSVAIVIALLNTFAILGFAKTYEQLKIMQAFKTCVLNISVCLTLVWAVLHLVRIY